MPTSVPTLRRCALVLAVVLAAAGCSTGGARQESRASWKAAEPAAYVFIYRTSGMAGVSDTEVTVRDGRVVASTLLPDSAFHPDPPAATIDGVFDRLARVQRDAAGVRVRYDDTYGFPASVSVDVDRDAIDEEYGFGVAAFRVLDGRAAKPSPSPGG